MDHSHFGEILKEASDIINKMCIDYSNLVYKSGYKELTNEPLKTTYFKLGENIDRIKGITENGNAKSTFMNFYYLTLLKKHNIFDYIKEKIIGDSERYEYWKTNQKIDFVVRDEHFYRFCSTLQDLKDDCLKLEKIIDKSILVAESMKKEFFSIVRKNFRRRYKKSLKKDGLLITYDIPITIRFAYGNNNEEERMIKTLDFFIGDKVEFDTNLLNDLIFFVEFSLDNIFQKNVSMFQPIYGNKIAFRLSVNLIDLDSDYGYVLGAKRAIPFLKYDGACKELEISINSKMVYESFLENSTKSIEDTFIHEFNHLFDSKIAKFNLSDIIRNEGIARFSETVFNNTPAMMNEKIIAKFKQEPLGSIFAYEQSASKNSQTPYVLGAYMCYKMFIYYLLQNAATRSYVTNTNYFTKPDARLMRIIAEPVIKKAGEIFIKGMRVMSAAQFYSYYLKSEDSEPIITEQFLKTFIEKEKR